MKKVIIVGAGIAGLTSGAYLSKEHEVVILEKSESIGGLIGSFSRGEILFDKGIRALENSGTVMPMLRNLGIDIHWKKSDVTIGIGKNVKKLSGASSLQDYKKLLLEAFPNEIESIEKIFEKIKVITRYMKVIYGVDNPLFLDYKEDYKYLVKTILPWMFKYATTVRKINKLDVPMNEYLSSFTSNPELIDAVTQHFFPKTPAFFALSYFSMLNDYYYPDGGMETLVDKLKDYIESNGGKILTGEEVNQIDAVNKTLTTSNSQYSYSSLIWAADLKGLYGSIVKPIDKKVDKIKYKICCSKGNKSLFIMYLSTNLGSDYFQDKVTSHAFLTPSKEGINSMEISEGELIESVKNLELDEIELKLFDWLKEFLHKQTYEIGIPVLSDPALAPKGKSGMTISFLFDYNLTKFVEEKGLYSKLKEWISKEVIDILDENYFSKLKENIIDVDSATPLTIKRRFNNSEGSTTGWEFIKEIPVESRMNKIASAVKTPFKDVYQASHWSFSPSGVPTSIILGKIASDKAK